MMWRRRGEFIAASAAVLLHTCMLPLQACARGGASAHLEVQPQPQLAVGETVILLHPPLPLVDVSM